MFRDFGKFILVILYLIILLIGVLIIAAGVYIIFELRSLTTITQYLPDGINYYVNILYFVPYVIIAVGGVVLLIALIGCCGTLTETKFLLVTYAVCMGILAAVKLVITVLVFVKLPDVTNTVERTVNGYFYTHNIAKKVVFHVLESQLECCGTFGPNAYIRDSILPLTCCARGTSIGDLANTADLGLGHLGRLGDIRVPLCRRKNSYKNGCTTLIVDAVLSVGKVFGFGLIIFISVEVFAMAVSIYLIKTKKPQKIKILDQQTNKGITISKFINEKKEILHKFGTTNTFAHSFKDRKLVKLCK